MRKLALALAPLVLTVGLASCQRPATMWGPCSPTRAGDATGTDGTYVLMCQKGEWVPIMTNAEYVDILAGKNVKIAPLPKRPTPTTTTTTTAAPATTSTTITSTTTTSTTTEPPTTTTEPTTTTTVPETTTTTQPPSTAPSFTFDRTDTPAYTMTEGPRIGQVGVYSAPFAAAVTSGADITVTVACPTPGATVGIIVGKEIGANPPGFWTSLHPNLSGACGTPLSPTTTSTTYGVGEHLFVEAWIESAGRRSRVPVPVGTPITFTVHGDLGDARAQEL